MTLDTIETVISDDMMLTTALSYLMLDVNAKVLKM